MDPSTARTLARLVAWGRVAVGVAALAAPRLTARPWVGSAADDPSIRLLARAVGGRDVALGAGALRALTVSGREARPWVALGGLADVVDAAVTIAAFRTLPRFTRWGIVASTVGAAVISLGAASTLDAQKSGR